MSVDGNDRIEIVSSAYKVIPMLEQIPRMAGIPDEVFF